MCSGSCCTSFVGIQECLMFARVNGRTGGIFLWQGEFGIAVGAVALDGCVFCS